ncbi:hypothetical protein FHT77_002669 [Rhizobium sp. BK181]|uniref:DUF982 domain-containing protein n=1 Tax=Rhizobium sp. BK181 TaxID=2587072 RepID=UPI0016088DBF|nr:DUF982 domain-containing protein [Rhizobium sp. BK181]MBB3316788.1 hypothetical protein [Rhizobium sp. BK181]
MVGEIPVFISPMDVEIEGNGRYRHADTVADLAAMLLSSKWPKSRPSFHSALMASLEAMEFYTDAATARAAFVIAAHEAGLRVLPDDGEKSQKNYPRNDEQRPRARAGGKVRPLEDGPR